jgi:hypothetical protein
MAATFCPKGAPKKRHNARYGKCSFWARRNTDRNRYENYTKGVTTTRNSKANQALIMDRRCYDKTLSESASALLRVRNVTLRFPRGTAVTVAI